MQKYLDRVHKPAGCDNSLNHHLFCLTRRAFFRTFSCLSRLCSATFIHCREKAATQPFISSPTASGVHQTRWQPRLPRCLCSFCAFNLIQNVVAPLCSCIFSHHGSLIYQQPYKEGPDRVRNSQHHSINPCDYPRLRGVWTVCLCVS